MQRAMARDTLAVLALTGSENVLDVGCGDGVLTSSIAARVPSGFVVGVDPAQGMLSAARSIAEGGESEPVFVRADVRQLPFLRHFDVVVSFNALHWVPQQQQALAQIAAVVCPGGQVLIQLVCAGTRTSLEEVAMELTTSPRWARRFSGFEAPFVHVDPQWFAQMASAAGFTVTLLTVDERDWDFGSREGFEDWCAAGLRAWTDRLPADDRRRFVAELVRDYERVCGRPAVVMFTQMRAELRR
ncbi:MAG TPA: methyltransferase domain-containing protein [Mycobacterium sp.]|nr:methyltransferase domain-containing protein [Mycobacterium sp.]